MSFAKILEKQFELFFEHTAFANFTGGHAVMLLIGLFLIFIAIKKGYAPLLLIPIGFGMLVGNIPLFDGLQVSVSDEGSVLNILHHGVRNGWYPALIFLGIGAMTDFSALIAKPKLILIGVAAQFGIFGAFALATQWGFNPVEAGAISIIGGADGPTAIFLASKLAPELLSVVAISAFIYMALAPLIQPPFMHLFTTKAERVIKIKPPRQVSKTEKIIFPIIGILLTCFIAPGGLPLLGMLFFGNLLKESGVTKRLALTTAGPVIDLVTVLIGLTIGASAHAEKFLTWDAAKIFTIGIVSFIIATIAGVLFVKFMNLFSKNKINPLIGSAGVAAVPNSAHVSNVVGQKYDKNNFLLMHANAPNVAGIIGSAVAAGILLNLLN